MGEDLIKRPRHTTDGGAAVMGPCGELDEPHGAQAAAVEQAARLVYVIGAWRCGILVQ